MPTSKTGRSKAQRLRDSDTVEAYRLASEVVERIRRGEEDVLNAEDFWHGLDDLTYTERRSPAAHSEKRG
ncbi:hypothetical protein RFN29_23485 [Mesorhizobium sp. VK22B]|uniref:Transcriptional regulator n=1 Tax=Mesorhizobium captivum TaxID=3072319 RepID=A0ABU4Z6C2_9HYPH|nr:hypothetical protein [Mesorhizobium sp. VK22B]MDX8494538.1 hypothetical protein [Mesorhizobium sp. VK22B]